MLHFLLLKVVPEDWPDLLRRLSGGAAARSLVAAGIHDMMVRNGTSLRRFPAQIASHAFAYLKDGTLNSVTSFAKRINKRLVKDHERWLRLGFGRVATSHTVMTGHLGHVNAVAALPDGRVVSGSNDGTVRLWEPRTGAETFLGRHDGAVNAVAAPPDGRVVSGSDDRSVRIWGPRGGGRLLGRHEGAVDGAVRAVAALPDGRIVSVSDDWTVRIWDLHGSGRLLGRHDGAVMAVAALPDGRVVTGSDDRTVWIWDTFTGGGSFMGRHDGWVWAVAALPDGRVATSSDDQSLRMWDSRTGEEMANFRFALPCSVTAVAADGARSRIIAGLGDGNILVWEVMP